MKKYLLYIAIPLTALMLSACMYHEPRSLPPGQYEDNSSSVDSKGTSRETKVSTDVYYDENGNKQYRTSRKTVTDPKGLFNKTTSTSSHTTK